VRADGVEQGRGAHRKERRTSFQCAEYDGRSTVGPWLDSERTSEKRANKQVTQPTPGVPRSKLTPLLLPRV
jgi:hypothetical protein